MTMPNLARDPYALSRLMDFDHVVRVHADGSVTDAEPGVWAPELSPEGRDVLTAASEADGWALLNGYSGQYGYRGPIMHPSEFIGGGMARDILARPGLYVALVAYGEPECEACDLREECHHGCRQGSHDAACPVEEWPAHTCDSDGEPEGWAVAYIADEAECDGGCRSDVHMIGCPAAY